MTANLYERSVTYSGKGSSWYYLADEPLVMDATIIVSPNNVSNVAVRFLGMSGSPMEIMVAAWPPGATVQLRNVDLSKIRVNVSSDHCVLVIGQAP